MLSSLTADWAQVTTDALLEGAFDFILKPSGSDAQANRRSLSEALDEKIQAFRNSVAGQPPRSAAEHATDPLKGTRLSGETPARGIERPATRYELVLIGTSTGGPAALREVLPHFPGDFPAPILIVQHMPPQYTHSLARRLNEASQIEVVEACDGMTLEPGWAYLAPGGRQMKLVSRGTRYVIRITDDPPENSCRPSIDYLMRSAAEVFPGKTIAVVMTGMGRDGTLGCRELKRRGAFVIAQHADGCVVYGMPKAVVEEQLADRVVTLERIAGTILARVGPLDEGHK
jgi:two-component system chemotaxis response regulator CheB